MNQKQLDDQFFVAVRDNKIKIASEYLIRGANVNHDQGLSLYTAVIMDDYHEMVKMLISSGADTNINNHKSIKSALRKGDTVILDMLFEPTNSFKNFNNDVKDSIYLATETNNGNFEINYEIVKSLIDRGVDIHINNEIALKNAVNSNNFSVVDLLMENGADIKNGGEYAIRIAAIKDYSKVLETIIVKHSITPNKDSLDWMAKENCNDRVESLIAKRDLFNKLNQNLQAKPSLPKKMKQLGMKL